MWLTFFWISVSSLILTAAVSLIIKSRRVLGNNNFNFFNALFAGVFVAAFFMFIPTHIVTSDGSVLGTVRSVLLSVFNSMQVFAFGCDFSDVVDSMIYCPESFYNIYQLWVSFIFVIAPVFTFGFVLSLFKNVSSYIKYLGSYFKDVYVFSELNDKSLVLAADIKKNRKDSVIVFNDVFESNEEKIYELIEEAKNLGAICFKKDILVVNYQKHSSRKAISFFAIGNDETENLNQTFKLIEDYKNRENTHIYIFSTKIESELLLTSIDKGKVKVRRINEVQALINRVLYERGEIIFESAKQGSDGDKLISAVVVGMGNHGTEMLKSLVWYGQMTGYRLEINAFDKDPLAEEKFVALAPELMSPEYNGVTVEGEAQYKITIHPSMDVKTISYADEISKLTNATYVFVALGNDDANINAAVNLRMYFERIKIHPVIQAVVYNPQQKRALKNIKNYSGQSYDIELVGDIDSSYTENVIIDSELEEDAQ